jgi:hypothetical protein
VTKLTLPKFEMPPLPPKAIPIEVRDALFVEEIRRLKDSGEYPSLRAHPSRQTPPVKFVLSEPTT